MDLDKLVKKALKRRTVSADDLVPHIYLTLSQAGDIVKADKNLRADLAAKDKEIKDLEELYSAATKALNSQIETKEQ